MPDPFSLWWFKTIAYATFAAFGGFLGHALRTINKNQKIHWGRAALEGIAAGFVGIIVMMTCHAASVPEGWTGVIVGVCGWLGASATIQMLETLVRKRLGIDGASNDATNKS